MNSKESKRDFIEGLRTKLSADEFGRLLRCLDPELGYETEALRHRLSQITPERLVRWEQERVEFQERMREREAEPSWCDPFITRLPPPRNLNLDVGDVTDLIKYVYATLSRAIAELQYQLAELTGTGHLDPKINEDVQGWCFRTWEILDSNTVAAVRNYANDDWDWAIQDNTYSTGMQVMTRVNVEPDETDQNHWEYNPYLAGDGPIQEYPRRGVFHIAQPPASGKYRPTSR
ncbi:MAG: hypothetical protein K8R24_08745 [Mycobacterium sp.]|nr:hypothetical protein [Mycobacterium sp.]